MLVWRPFQRRPAQARICHIRNEFASLRLVDGRNSMRSFPMRRGKRLLLRFRRRRAQPMTFPLFPESGRSSEPVGFHNVDVARSTRADILVLVRNHFADWLGNRDLRRRRRGLRLRLSLSTGRQHWHEQDCQQPGHSQCLHKRRHEAHHLGTSVCLVQGHSPHCAGTHRGPTNVGLQISPRMAPALAPTLWPSGRS